jgi:hypothetical protein
VDRLDAEIEFGRASAALPPDSPPVAAPFTPASADFRSAVTEVRGGWVTFPVPPGTALKRFDRLRVLRAGGAAIAEVVVLDARGAPSGYGIPLPGAAIRPGDQLRP